MKSQFYDVISVLTVILSFVPAVIVLLKKLWQAVPFNFFAAYWVVNGLINAMLLIKDLNKKFLEVAIVIYNAIDIPMMVGVIYLAAFSDRLKRFIRISLVLFIVFEIACLIHGGFDYDSLKYALGVGLLFILTIIIWQISLFLQQIEHASREKALLLIHGALLFQYGTYIVVYIFDYYLIDFADTVDKFLIYYISTIISIAIGSSGLLLKGLRRIPATAAIKRSFWDESRDRSAR
ncbi:hypothetical protein [Paraflavitalea pollutisoli]|uniref:hypothetical protein n=1 Tax=Paraflavitalea pollutisoli TaxID=3034143 RepID=UPI0023EDCDDD|nr:hypothetical protein [Paraflavitalea sp. H1-2-19X]